MPASFKKALLLKTQPALTYLPLAQVFICPRHAEALMTKHNWKYALIIGTEVLSSIVDWEDRATCVLFGDGAELFSWKIMQNR